MAVSVPIVLKCDYRRQCDNTVQATAAVVGRHLSKIKLDLTETTVPVAWTIRMEEEHGYGHTPPPEVKCYCPEHDPNKDDPNE